MVRKLHLYIRAAIVEILFIYGYKLRKKIDEVFDSVTPLETVIKAIWHLLQRRNVNTKQKGFRLTARDIEVDKFVAEQNCVRLDTKGYC